MPALPLSTLCQLSPPDTAQAEQFLRTLDPHAKSFLFFIKTEDGAPRVTRQPLTQQLFSSLRHWNSQGSNIYVTCNETNHGNKVTRTREEVTRFNAVFSDNDAHTPIPFDKYPLPPSCVVETSPGKQQLFWFLSDQPPDVDVWDQVQQTFVNDWGGDANARDAARVLRVPGFYNTKAEYSPSPLSVIKHITNVRYTWAQIIQAFPPSQVLRATGQHKDESLQLRETMEQAATGANYHDANLRLVGWLANMDTRNRDQLISWFQAQMDVMGNPADTRFQQRRNIDLPGSVDWVLKKRKQEEQQDTLVETTIEEKPLNKYTHLPMPGGNLYKVVQWVKSLMWYPNDTIAIAVAEHLVSVFGGGHYHLMQNTTTRKRILLAQTGTGKDTIAKALGMVVRGLEKLSPDGMPYVLNADEFLGSDSFSFSVQHKQLEQHRVRSFVVNEAGEAGKSQAGDISNMRAYQLQALSTKSTGVMRTKKFSEQGKGQEDKQLKAVYNGVWVYFHESTLRSYAEVLNDSRAFESGDLARSDIFFADPILRDHNKNPQVLTEDMRVLFTNLANDLRNIPGQKGCEDYDVWEEIDYSEIKQRLDELRNDIINKRNEATKQENDVRTGILSRRHERILTTILLCAIADSGGVQKPVAKNHHLDYAIDRVRAIDAALHFHTRGGGVLGDNSYEEARENFIKICSDIINDNRTYDIKNKYRFRVFGGGLFLPKGNYWILAKTSISRLFPVKNYKSLVNIHKGDSERAFSALMRYMEEMEVVYRNKVKDGDGFKTATPLKWVLNSTLFPVKEKQLKRY